MANTYTPESLGIKAPSGGFQTGGWYSGRQYWGGTLSDPGVINPLSNQQGAGQLVSPTVNAASAVQQGTTPQKFEDYLAQQRKTQPTTATPTVVQPTTTSFASPTTATEAGFAGTGIPTQQSAALNLPEVYQNLYKASGVSELENQYATMAKQFTDAKAKINDNPFLSEATRVGRVAKLEQLFNERTANLRDEIAVRKSDIDTQLNLQTKQYDINSQQSQMALDRLNTLLNLGALDTASSQDLVNLAQSTGLSTSAIQSAIKTNKAKNLQTSIQSYDDGVNQGVKIFSIDEFGNIVNVQTQIIGASTKSSTGGIEVGVDSESEWEVVDSSTNQTDISNLWSMATSKSTTA